MENRVERALCGNHLPKAGKSLLKAHPHKGYIQPLEPNSIFLVEITPGSYHRFIVTYCAALILYI